MKFLRAIIVGTLMAPAACAHAGEVLEPHDLWQAWTFDPGVVVPLVVTGFLYARGARRSRGVSISDFACFWTGWVVLALALVSPVHPLGEVLFSAHMTQHELLMVGAAPLLVLSRPLAPMLWGLPMSWRKSLGNSVRGPAVRKSWSFITGPMAAWWIHAAALWLWHVPRFFQATLENEWIHSAQHLSFFGSALLFWWSLFYRHGRAHFGASFLYVFTTAVHTSILGALLTFSSAIWYPAYVQTTSAWGFTVLEDQQLGGLIMWIPAALVYLAAGLWLFNMWLRESDLSAMGREYAR
jgi:putative membrane protein